MANGNMIPVGVMGKMPPEANSKGALNETVSAAERNRKTPTKLDDGPKRGDKGEYLPAAYAIDGGMIREDR